MPFISSTGAGGGRRRREIDQPVALDRAGRMVARQAGAHHHAESIERLGELGVGEALGQIGDKHVAAELFAVAWVLEKLMRAS